MLVSKVLVLFKIVENRIRGIGSFDGKENEGGRKSWREFSGNVDLDVSVWAFQIVRGLGGWEEGF